YQLHTTIDNLHRFLNGDSLLEFNSFSQKLTSLNDQYNKEARIKYGHTEQYKEYEANLASMNEEELQNFNKNITHRVESIYQNLANWSDDSPDSDRIQREIVKLHNCFNKTMSCSLDLFLYIAEQFVADNRFQNYFIKFGYNELPTFIYKAVQYYCQEKST